MYSCECGYKSTAKYNLKRHRQSKTHQLNMLCFGETLMPDTHGIYTCDSCNFSTSRRSNYRDHLLSEKHASTKTSTSATSSTTVSVATASSYSSEPVMLMEVMEMFLSHLKDESTQNRQLLKDESVQKNELFKTFADRIAAHQQSVIQTAETMTNTMMTNTTTSNNSTKFNLNLFLNEECKNAMNMSDFIQTVVVTMEDLEHLGEVGYTEGMSKILTKAIRSTETSERPMHCTDVKRETIYVRKDDAWKKGEDCEETKRLIQHISHKNYKALSEWREQHPEHTEPDTADYEAWYSISRNMCNTDPSALKKLIRHLALTTAVEKSQLVST